MYRFLLLITLLLPQIVVASQECAVPPALLSSANTAAFSLEENSSGLGWNYTLSHKGDANFRVSYNPSKSEKINRMDDVLLKHVLYREAQKVIDQLISNHLLFESSKLLLTSGYGWEASFEVGNRTTKVVQGSMRTSNNCTLDYLIQYPSKYENSRTVDYLRTSVIHESQKSLQADKGAVLRATSKIPTGIPMFFGLVAVTALITVITAVGTKFLGSKNDLLLTLFQKLSISVITLTGSSLCGIVVYQISDTRGSFANLELSALAIYVSFATLYWLFVVEKNHAMAINSILIPPSVIAAAYLILGWSYSAFPVIGMLICTMTSLVMARQYFKKQRQVADFEKRLERQIS